MIKRVENYRAQMNEMGWEFFCPSFVQTMSESELIDLVPQYDGWIIGDDPATGKVFSAGKKGRLKAAVKWGVGVDNVDFAGAKAAGVPIVNTPGVFGNEVADVATGYLLMLARQLHVIDREVRKGNWFKPAGTSVHNQTIGVVGFGDIGRNTVKRCRALGAKVVVFDPRAKENGFNEAEDSCVTLREWPQSVESLDCIIFTCALTPQNRGMFNASVMKKCKMGAQVINVARGPLINEADLIEHLSTGHLGGAALDVFESEPLSTNSKLMTLPNVIVGSHNGSNTKEAVDRVSFFAIGKLESFFKQGLT